MLKTITVTNFMNISKATIDFTSGITALLGKVGQGKSAILEAISYCILNKTKGSSWKDYIRSGSTGFTIHLEVYEPSGELVVFDYTGSSSKGSVVKDITYGKDLEGKDRHYYGEDANALIVKLFDTETLENIVFNMQSRKTLSAIKPADSRALFKKVFNTDFPDIIEKIREDKTTQVTQSNLVAAQISLLEGKNYPFFRIAEVDETKLPGLQLELQKSQESQLTKQKYLFYIEKVNNLTRLQAELSSNIMEQITAELTLSAQQNKVTSLMADKEVRLAQLEAQNILIEDITKELDKAKLELEEFIKSFDLTQANKELEDLLELKTSRMAEIKILEKHIEVHSKGICESCGQACESTKIPDMLKNKELLLALLSDIDGKRTEINSSITSYTTNKEFYKEGIVFGNTRKASLESKAASINKELDSLDNMNTLVTNNITSSQSSITKLSDRIDFLNAKIITVTQEVADSKVEETTEDTRDLQLIQDEINSIMTEIQRNIEQEKINEQLRAQRNQDQLEISRLNGNRNEILRAVEDIDSIIKIFEVDFPSYLNLRACTLLQAYMNSFFDRVKDEFKIKLEVDKKGIVFKYKAHDEPTWIPIDMASGFEAAMLTLGFNCSIAMAYHQPLIILDEPDKDADEVASERLMETILGLDVFKQIVIISHNPACKEVLVSNDANIYEVHGGKFIKTY
jgi:DNA repair exonuclease SbcCD ATPase subunit